MITFIRDWRGYAKGTSVATIPATLEAVAVAEGAATYGGIGDPPNTMLDKDGNVTGLVSGDGNAFLGSPKPFQMPYMWASFGDSRANTNSTVPDVSGHASSLAINKAPWWAAAARKDSEFYLNYGVSGDPASNWNAGTRSGSVTTKPISSLVASAADAVYMQYGVNDIISGNGTTPTAATIAGYLQLALLELFKAGKIVMFESILPCTAAGWTSSGSGTAAQKQAIADATNALVSAFCAQFSSMCRYIDNAAQMKGSDGYANPAYYADSIHLNNDGSRVCGEAVAAASLTLMPRKAGVWFPSGIQTGPNFIDMVAPVVTNILTGVAGTFSLGSQTTGWDSDGPYTEWVLTPLTLSSGEATFWGVLGADVGGFGATPKYTLAANDVLQGQCRLLVDDGAGGIPSGLRNVTVRQRCYYQAGGGTYADAGSNAVPSGQALFTGKIDELMTTPRMTTTVASAGIEPPTHVKGYGLHIYVSVSQVGTPIRIRATAPSLRKAA